MGRALSDDDVADQEALHRGAGAVFLDRGVVRCSGPDACDYLQGQLSQDVASLPVGDAAWAFLLQPQGKVTAWLRVTREGHDAFLLDTDSLAVDATVARLARFKLRSRLDLDVLPWRCLALRGASVPALLAAPPPGGGGTTVTRTPWPQGPVVDLLGPSPEVPDGVRTCGASAYEALRIEQGVPAVGAELTEATIPAEAGPWVMDVSVSFTKGCYTGQELVARIDSRGSNVPRPVRGLVVAGDEVPPVGAGVRGAGGEAVGRVTSSAWSVRLHAPVALAVVARSVAVGDVVTIQAPAGATTATVASSPLAHT